MHWVVIPFRGIETAKSRLAGTLSDAARRHVARAMFQHTLNVACKAVGARHVLVVTPSRTAARMAKLAGASVLKEKEPSLNGAVTAACDHLRVRGKATATIIASDLPLITHDHVKRLIERARSGYITIARDKTGEGTNAISLPLSARFRFMFGEYSFFQHVRQRARSNSAIRTLRDPALEADIDVAEDLVLLDAPGALSTLPVARNLPAARLHP